MPCMTLFDVSDLFGADPTTAQRPGPGAASRIRAHRPAGGDTGRGRRVEPVPEVEVRVSARRKKTSEAKWVGGRIVVSLPAHLDLEARQKTIDWLVERL